VCLTSLQAGVDQALTQTVLGQPNTWVQYAKVIVCWQGAEGGVGGCRVHRAAFHTPVDVLHLGCLLLRVIFWVFWTGSGPTSGPTGSLLDMCTASGGGPLGQLSPVSSLACMPSLLHT